MTQFLPPNLLALFAARDPINYLPPAGKLPHEKEIPPYEGLAAYVHQFEDPRDAPPPTRVETKEERKERKVCLLKCVKLEKLTNYIQRKLHVCYFYSSCRGERKRNR